MLWNRYLTTIRNVLAGLYWRNEDIRRIVIESGINPVYISFGDRPINVWQSVIEEAQKREMLDEIIDVARKEYPKVPSLELAQNDLLLSIQTPEIVDNMWQGPTDSTQLEKIMGSVSTLRPISFLALGLKKADSSSKNRTGRW